MTGTQTFALVVSGILVLLTVINLLVTSRRSWQERQLMRLAERVNLSVPEHLEVELQRHITRRGRASTIGVGATFLFVSLPLVLILPDATLLQGVVPVAIAFAGGSLTTAVTALNDRRRGTFGAPSVGRLRGPAVSDLVPARLVRMAAVIVVVSAVLATVAMLPPNDVFAETPSASAALALVGIATLTAWWWGSRALAHRRPMAGDATTLAWSDALRAESIRDLLLLPATAAMLSMVDTVPAALVALAGDDGAARSIAINVSFFVPLAVLIPLVIVQCSYWTSRHYQRHLWPELTHPRIPGLAPALPAAGRI